MRSAIGAVLIVTLGGPVSAAERSLAEPVVADPPPLTNSVIVHVEPAGADAQLLCATPVNQLQETLVEAMATGRVTSEHKQAFLDRLARCRSVYQMEMLRLNRDFSGLAEDSFCHAAEHELNEGLAIFAAIEAKARRLPMHTQEQQQAAAGFFNMTSPGLVRVVNGLYLLRHGVCMEEQRAPFDPPRTDAEISQPAVYQE